MREFFRAYDVPEADASLFRARQLQSLLSATPIAMAINVGNALLVSRVMWGQIPSIVLVTWTALVFVLAAVALRGWQRARTLRPRRTASRRAHQRAEAQAAMLALVYAAVPMLFMPEVDLGRQLVLALVTTGLICGGGFVLSSLPWAATTFVSIIGAGGLFGIARSGMPGGPELVWLLLTCCLIVVYSAWVQARMLGARMVAEVKADRQSEVIALLLRDFEDQASDLLWELDVEGRFNSVSQRLAKVLGLGMETLGKPGALAKLGERVPETDDARAHWESFTARLDTLEPFRDQVVSLRAGEEERWWSITARPLFDERGEPSGWRGVAADITEKHLAHRSLSWLAHNDALTGLVNRSQFRASLRGLLQGPPSALQPLAVVAIDLDGFKQVNDTQGHAAGDQLLQAFGEKLLSVARRGDTVARLGGDEFAVLLRGVTSTEAITAILQRLLVALEVPCEVAGRLMLVRASMGVAVAPTDGADVDTLMSHSDIALYTAKRSGGSHFCFFHQALAEAGRRRAAIREGLRGALERGELCLEYQPQVSAVDWKVEGFEALLRWRHPELGSVGPGDFVPIAEDAGLMTEIGEWVLREACNDAAQWPRPVRVSINVSPLQLSSSAFVERVLAATAALPPSRVELEITESALIADADSAVLILNALRGRGYLIALDDFGTGYSALGYLRHFAFDTLKIDRSFVSDLVRDGEAQIIIEAILAMARALSMTTVAEGVETETEAEMLRARGCALLQGYLIHKPLPAAQVSTFLVDWEQGRLGRCVASAAADDALAASIRA
ncbi:MAG: EAL domain-containing protein [Planctomycetota bacterium]